MANVQLLWYDTEDNANYKCIVLLHDYNYISFHFKLCCLCDENVKTDIVSKGLRVNLESAETEESFKLISFTYKLNLIELNGHETW